MPSQLPDMNIRRPQLEAAIEAATLVLAFEYPADAVLSRYFRQHSALGRADRAFVAEAVFGILRRHRTLEHLYGARDPRQLVLAWLVRIAGRSVRELTPALSDGEAQWLAEQKAKAPGELPVAVRAELPDWIHARLATQLGEDELAALGLSLQQPAPLDLRVNTLRAGRDEVVQIMRAEEIDASPTPLSPVGVRLRGNPAINRHRLFLDGTVEVQDEGSQIIGYLMAPRRHELVVDFCAGAGGKTLMLGAMMHTQGRVYAFDVSPARLARLKPRLKRSGLSNLHPLLLASENDQKVKRLAGKIDRVLVDAPCSGFGTLRRNPDLKWRQTEAGVAEMREKQSSILRAAATLVKPGGRLVYATCSLLAEENEDVIDSFSAQHPEFKSLNCGELLSNQSLRVETGERLRLWPHVHGTDGFFGAVFTRERA